MGYFFMLVLMTTFFTSARSIHFLTQAHCANQPFIQHIKMLKTNNMMEIGMKSTRFD